MIPQSFLQDLLSRVDIADVVGRHVELKKAGINLKGLCPFHGEKSPSFIVSPSRQTYHCFGCGAHGDAIRFLVEHTGARFTDAVEDLAQQVGLQVPQDDSTPEERERASKAREHQHTLTEVLERAAEHFRKQLKSHPRAVDYLKRRGLTGRIAAQFGMGYAPDEWRGLASVYARYDDPLLEESGLVIRQGDEQDARRYDRFRDRIMFPIRSVQGEVIGFGGRVIDQGEPKYLNSPETPVFVKGRELYGLHEARTALRKSGYALVVEGYMDVVALAQSGLENAVATLGTACTADHMHKLFRFTDSVVFSFDGDAAGRRAASRALEASLPFATDTRTIRFLFLPPEHDPDSFVRELGRDAFEQAVRDAVPLSRQLIDVASEGCDLATAEGRAKTLATARPMWHALPDGALRRQLLAELANVGHLSTADLGDLWQSSPQKTPGGAVSNRPKGAATGGSRSSGFQQSRSAHPAHYSHADEARDSDSSYGYGQAGSAKPNHRAGKGRARGQPPGNADHAMRLLLLHSQWWDELSAPDHELLHGLDAPHGTVCAWLERQMAEHGPLPWSALAAAARAQADDEHASSEQDELAAAVQRLVPPSSLGDDATFSDLRLVVDRLWVEELKAQETRLAEAAGRDPEALSRYKAVLDRRRALERTLVQTNEPAAAAPRR